MKVNLIFCIYIVKNDCMDGELTTGVLVLSNSLKFVKIKCHFLNFASPL